ncbi:UNVERIFIED_CONTAM: hypothetical protein K2H54_002410 [Gekko kuhli]
MSCEDGFQIGGMPEPWATAIDQQQPSPTSLAKSHQGRQHLDRFKGGHQKEDVLAEQPEAFQVDYELDPPVLFSINPDDNRGLLGGFKSLAEELMDATEQPMNQQPLNQHLVLASQPAPENPSPRSIGKVKNGCVLDKQIFEEIEMIAPTAGEAILEVTSPEDYRDSNIK